MNKLELLSQISGIKANEVIRVSQSHIGNRSSIIFADKNDNVFETHTTAHFPIDTYQNDVSDNNVAEYVKQGADVEDIKDLFRTNDIENYYYIITTPVTNYNNNLAAWNMTIDDFAGKVNSERACVSDLYFIDKAELEHNGQVLAVTYSDGLNHDEYDTEVIRYVNYNPAKKYYQDLAEKAVIARNVFGKERANKVVFHNEYGSIVSQEEYDKLPELQQLHYNKYDSEQFDTTYYVRIDNVDTLPAGQDIKAIIDDIIDDKVICDSKFAENNGLHQGHLSEMRNGKRSVERMTLANVIKYVNAYHNRF